MFTCFYYYYCLGFVFTSPRAVEAIHRAIKEDENLADFWKKCPAYCIGPSTESTAKNLLKLENCLGSNCGNSQDLAKLITQVHKKKNKPILYPCSAIARDTIQLILENEEITFEKIVSYDTLPSETLERDLLNIASDTEQIFIFFSPSIVKFIMTIAEKHNLIKNMKFVGIGDVTGEALKQFGVKIHGISEKPEPEALLQIIKNTTN